MIYGRKALQVGVLIVLSLAFVPNTARAQQDDELSCAERMTEQLRRFNENCLSELMSFVVSQSGLSAKNSALAVSDNRLNAVNYLLAPS